MSYTVVRVPFGESNDLENHDRMLSLADKFHAQGTASKTFRRQNITEVTTSLPYSKATGTTFTMIEDEVRAVREGWIAFAQKSDALEFIKAYSTESEDAPSPVIGIVDDDFRPQEWDNVYPMD